MKKRFWAMALALCMILSLTTVTALAAEPMYSDTKGHWAEQSIERWSEYKIVQGNNGQFDPNGQLTCAQLATILSRLLKLSAAPNAGFSDNTADAWYFDSINRCAAAGILKGNGDGTVTPSAPITRERAMVMLGRALGIEPIQAPDLSKYADAANIAPYAQGMVAAMIEAGIVSGVGDNQLAPKDEINRASTVTILDRAISTYADKAGETIQANGGLALVVADDVTLTGSTDKLLVPTDGIDVTLESSKSTDSIVITGDDSTVTVKNSSVDAATVSGDRSKIILSNAAAGEIALSGANNKVETAGSAKVDSVTVTENAKDATISVGSGTTVKAVENKAADTTVTGSGTVSKVASDTSVTIETKNTNVTNTGNNNIIVTDKNGKDNSVSNGSGAGSTTTVNKDTTSGGSSGGGSSGHSHSYAAEWTFNDETHWHASTCGHDVKGSEAAHTYGENGVCTVCGQVNPTEAVAQIGSKNYKTLSEAVEAAVDGQTVTVVKDIALDSKIVISKKITVDLNGKTVTRDMSAVSENFTRNEGNLFIVQSAGDLTVKDSVGSGVLTATAPGGNHYSTDALVLNYGKFALESGTIKAPEQVYYAVGCYGKDSITTINGGVIDAQWGNASDGGVAIGSNGSKSDDTYGFTLTINGGEVKGGEQTLYLPGAGKTTINGGKLTGSARGIEIRAGELTITGGEISANAARKTDAAANNGASGSYTGALVAVKPAGVSASGYVGDIVLNISGGTFTNNSGDVLTVVHENPSKADAPAQNVTVNVSDGQFTGGFNIGNTINTAANDKLGMTGGTYSTDPSAYVAPGYTATESGSVWTIASLFNGGTGTASDPFLIASVEQWNAVDTASQQNYARHGNKFTAKPTIFFALETNLDIASGDKGQYGYYAIQNLRSTQIDGRGHTVTLGTDISPINNMYYSELKDITFVLNGMPVVGYFCNYKNRFDGVNVEGSLTTEGNMGAYVIYAGLPDLYFENCITNVTMKGNGDATNYNALFVGYAFGGADAKLSFKNCENKGTILCGKATMFVANAAQADTVHITVQDVRNSGTIQATYISSEYTFNYYNAVGTSDQVAKYYINGSTVSGVPVVANDTIVTNDGIAVNAPENTGMELRMNDDSYLTVTPATDGKIGTNTVSYYDVSVGLYTGLKYDPAGSLREYVVQRIAADSDSFVSGLKKYSFVDETWVSANSDATVSTISDGKGGTITLYAKDGVTYYYLPDNEEGTLNGKPKAPQMFSVSAYSADGTLLASVALGN